MWNMLVTVWQSFIKNARRDNEAVTLFGGLHLWRWGFRM